MCTSGVVSAIGLDGRRHVYLGKTLDFCHTGCWHAVVHHSQGHDALCLGMTPQLGVNSGINSAGLAVILSYLDYRGPFEAPNDAQSGNLLKWKGDDRGVANAALLARCTNVQEAVEFLYDFIPRYPGVTGGNHMLADASGQIAVFEHCNGQMQHQFYTEAGFTARGNNGLLVRYEEQAKLPAEVREDRETRYSAMLACMRETHAALCEGAVGAVAERNFKDMLSSHGHRGADGLGSICVHGLALPGGRASSPLPNWTISGIIIDVTGRKMSYTVGNPCQSEWRVLQFPA